MSQNKTSISASPIFPLKIRTDYEGTEEEEVPLFMFANEEKISYAEYHREPRPPIYDLLLNENNQNEDWEWENESGFMADMPTKESYTVSDDWEENEQDNAIKFLTETGMLTKVENKDYFDLNIRSDSSVLGDIDTFSKSANRHRESFDFDFKGFEESFEEDEFNPAETLEKQLEKDPIPEPISINIIHSDKLSEMAIDSLSDIEIFSPSNNNINEYAMLEIKIKKQELPSPETTNGTEKEVNENPKWTKKKLTEFGYLLQRKGFRLMRKYYKEKFELFAQQFDYKKRVKLISPNEINQMIAQFIQQEFSAILPVFWDDERFLLLDSLKCIVLSDRSNKREPMIQGVDFGIVRNLFGKYTQKMMKSFMKNPANSFLYTHFYLINGRFACFEQSDVDQNNFNEQMKKLMLEAFHNMFGCIKPLYERLYENNVSNL